MQGGVRGALGFPGERVRFLVPGGALGSPPPKLHRRETSKVVEEEQDGPKMPPRCLKRPASGLQEAPKKPARGAKQGQTAPTTPKDAPQTTQKTTQRSSKIIF